MKISLHHFSGSIKSFAMSNFRKFCYNLCYHKQLDCKKQEKSLGQKRKRENDAKCFKAHGKEGLPICCYYMEEITCSKLNTEEKVEMIFMQSVAIILEKQQNLNIFGIFNQVLKSLIWVHLGNPENALKIRHCWSKFGKLAGLDNKQN